MSARRTTRDERRRRLGQNFVRTELADRIVAEARIAPGELVIDIGAGTGAFSVAAARRGAEVISVEVDPAWAQRLGEVAQQERPGSVRVVSADFLSWPLPARPFRVVGSLPFGSATVILRRLFDRPDVPLVRADLILQWEVARKRAAAPPTTLVSASWAPW